MPPQPHQSQGCVHFKRVDNMADRSWAYCSSCSRMDERRM